MFLTLEDVGEEERKPKKEAVEGNAVTDRSVYSITKALTHTHSHTITISLPVSRSYSHRDFKKRAFAKHTTVLRTQTQLCHTIHVSVYACVGR